MTKYKKFIFDIESNGLLPHHTTPPFVMDKIHCLALKCIDSGKSLDFKPDDMDKAVEILGNAEYVAGHNIIGFDIPALQMIYPVLNTANFRIYDTLVMSRMCFADVKESDFRLFARGKLDGKLIGTQGLEAWGQRLGLHKGDYKVDREEELKRLHKEAGLEAPTKEELHMYVWGTWNESMHDYMVNDVEVNFLLWEKLQAMEWSHESTVLEHTVHALMDQQERNGFFIDRPKLEKLEKHLRAEHQKLTDAATAEIGEWYRPCRVHKDEPNVSDWENADRRIWGNVDTVKRTVSYKKSNEKMLESGMYDKLRPDMTENSKFVRVELKEFNPSSRQQVVDRFGYLYGWEPRDFTEKGTPIVDDTILRELSEEIPLANTIAEIFFYQKRLGLVADGKNGWLKLIKDDGRIHGRVNCGGAVTGRATHAAPNVSQVPGVTPKEFKKIELFDAYIESNKNKSISTGLPKIISSKWNDKKGEGKVFVRGRDGEYGWDCREVFTVEKGYKLIGTDLSGVEFRCLGNLTFPFDDGEIVDVVLNGDIHQRNADATGIPRGKAKTLLYAALYGGGDVKLGSIMEPLASEAKQMMLGKQAREKLMKAMPSLDKAIKEIKREKRRNNGTIRGLDGRRLYIRSDHAALNTRLQSDGALIAKKWITLIDEMFYDMGWDHHIKGEYAYTHFVHDEIGIAVREGLEQIAADVTIKAAALAGEYFNFKCPIAAESKIGMSWAETH